MEGPEGTPLGGAASQRRLLALLALLAVAGDEGLTRDRILGLLWADADPERARHALTQSLYHARRALAADDLFVTAAGVVRLNRACLTSDVAEFREAVAAGDLARAAALQRGPFLDGFYLSGNADFEQWVTAQRDRLARAAADVLERLARAAEERRAPAEAVSWRRRLVALDPLDSARTLRLMESLAAAGDRVGALQQARLHAELLHQELEIGPASEILALEQRLRSIATPPHSIAPAAPRAATVGHDGGVAVAEAPLAATATTVRPAPDASPTPDALPAPDASRGPDDLPRRRARTRYAPALLLAVLLALVAAVVFLRPKPEPVRPAGARPALVVAPFRVVGADRSLAFLREGLVELLAARLAGDSAARAVDAGSVLRAWRTAGLTSTPEVPREEAVRLAGSLGAARVVVGSVVGSPARVVLSASLVTVPDGRVTAQTSIEGTTDSLTALVDRLAARLLATDAGEDDRLAAHTTPSVEALRDYLRAQAAYRRGDYLGAVPLYESALARDSGFALAALQLAIAADRANDAEQHDRALALAWHAQHDLSPHDRAHLVALAGPRYPEPSSAAEYLAAWERAAELAPDRAEVWYELGERFLHDGGVLGIDDGRARAGTALQRALQLDPGHAASRQLLILLAARDLDTAALARLASPSALRDSLGRYAPFIRWRVAVARGDAAAVQRLYAELPRQGDATLRMIAMTSQYDGVVPEHGERALRVRQLRATRLVDRLDVLLAQHSAALNAGRPALALDITRQLGELQPGARAHLRLRVLDAIHGDGDTTAAAEAAAALAAAVRVPASAPVALAAELADRCVLEQWRLARGSLAGARRTIARLRHAGGSPAPMLVGAAPGACAAILDAQLAVAEGRRDARALVRRLDSLMLSGPGIGDAVTYAPIVVARLYSALGDREAALAAIRRRSYLGGWPRYLATTRLLEGRLAAQLGERAEAAAVLQRYLALRERADPSVVPQVDSARAMLRRLGD